MKEQNLKSWEEFEEISTQIISETRDLKEKTEMNVSCPLFRGQSNSKWKLESTLDRIKEGMSLSDYYKKTKIIRNDIATCLGKKWDLSKIDETKLPFEWGDSNAGEFWVYLRHNGFASPLLDWTQSPYIAAFFAFRDICDEKEQEKYVSIFAYREYMGKSKSWASSEPHIYTVGPNIETDQKHYLQQNEYSICHKEENGEIYFARHEDVYEVEGQDILIKYNIPIVEQKKVLRKLQLMNIIAFSLFNSETSLMETLSVREFFLPNG